MPPPSLVIPSNSPADPSLPLPELPSELLLALHSNPDKDALDSFVLGGNVSVEDLLNELIVDGQFLLYSPQTTAKSSS